LAAGLNCREPNVNVCFWHKADMITVLSNVRFWGKADIARTSLDVCF